MLKTYFSLSTRISICSLANFLLLALMFAFPLHAKETETSEKSQEDLQKLVAILQNIDTFSANFSQSAVDQRGSRSVQSEGAIKAKRPGLFYWKTTQPLEQVIYSDGEKVTVYDPDLEQATVQKIASHQQTTPALLFSGDVQEIGDVFSVDYVKWEIGLEQFLLMPKAADSLFDRLVLLFDNDILKEMRITDSLGQDSTISFEEVKLNENFPIGTFTAKLPEGTDIIRDIPQLAPTSEQ